MTSNEVLKYLSDRPGVYASGQAIAGELGVSRAAVWKAVESLRAEGYGITSVSAKGYRLDGVPDRLGEREMLLGLSTRMMGGNVHAFEKLESTNTTAMKLASDGAPEGTLVVSDAQSAGRGRLGRRWASPPGKNIYASVILRPEFPPSKAPLVTLAASVALCRAINSYAGLEARIKWPNDILADGRKLAGILTEMSSEPDRVRHVVIGMGVNVNSRPGDLPRDVAGTATSIIKLTGRETSRAGLLQQILGELEAVYDRLVADGADGILEDWRKLSDTIGSKVRVVTQEAEFTGRAIDIDASGALVIERTDGKSISLTSGDVVHLR